VQGSLKNSGGFQKINPFDEKSPFSDIHAIMHAILGDTWDSQLNGQKVKFSQISTHTFDSFLVGLTQNKKAILEFGDFDQIKITDLSIIPNNLKTAIKWLKHNLTSLCEKTYLPIRKFREYIDEFKHHRELQNYENEIDVLPTDLASDLKISNEATYWHCQACIDLDIPQAEGE
jgi:hypothetical protein